MALLAVVAIAFGVWASGLIGADSDSADHGTGVPTLALPPVPAPVLAADSASGVPPTPAGLAAALRAPLADSRLGGRLTGQVVDLASGATVFDRDSTHLATPASTTKITTAVAALSVLPADYRIPTKVVAGATSGEVVIVGGGDVTLSAAAPGQSTTYDGAARLSDLAAAVKSSGTPVTKVVYDASLFPGPAVEPTWDPTDIDNGFMTPIRPLMADGGRTDPTLRAEAHEEPRPRSHQPDLDAARTFAHYLGLPPAAVVAGSAPTDARTVAQVQSPPLVTMIEQMLQVSDNVLGEGLIRQVAIAKGAPPSFQGATDAVRAVLKDLGIDTSTERLVDGSGVSMQDRLSPSLLTNVLRVASSPDHARLHALFGGLPVGGYDGTLDNRYLDGPTALGAGVVRAKTGTLTGVSTLSGVVEDADGRLLAFAFMADKVPVGGTRGAEAALDGLASAVAHCGCT